MTSSPAVGTEADPVAVRNPGYSIPPAAKSMPAGVLLSRWLAWVIVATLGVFLLNVYLNFWRKWPGAMAALEYGGVWAWLQVGLYVLALMLPLGYVSVIRNRSLRADARVMVAISDYLARAAFWGVLLVGLADATVSFLRVEALLPALIGEALAQDLGRNQYRALFIHVPLLLLGGIIALFRRGLDFAWLALLVVMAELPIVISRFVFSYEQAFMADLVRLWYAGLFLFASAYTLFDEGHVRVDVLYTDFSARTKGAINAIGALLLGLPLCWVILILGMNQASSIITAPLLQLEITQSGFGLYVKYIMAGYLAVFATTMAIHFAAYFLEGIADYRGDSGKRAVGSYGTH